MKFNSRNPFRRGEENMAPDSETAQTEEREGNYSRSEHTAEGYSERTSRVYDRELAEEKIPIEVILDFLRNAQFKEPKLKPFVLRMIEDHEKGDVPFVVHIRMGKVLGKSLMNVQIEGTKREKLWWGMFTSDKKQIQGNATPLFVSLFPSLNS